MLEAKPVLKYENMQPEDQVAYKRHVENRRIEMGVMETAIDKAKRENMVEVAKKLLLESLPFEFISKITNLSQEEIMALSKGENIDNEED